MPRRHDHLFDRIASFPALHAAAKRAIRGKRRKPGAAAFMADLEVELLQLERELKSGDYRSGQYLAFEVRDPKPRTVSAAPFRDRVVHHALYDVVGPIFERGFVHDSYANRVGKGTHRAVSRYERCRERYRYVLRCDIHRYFPAIDHEVLKQDLHRRIGCAPTLGLLDTIIDGSNPQEPVHLYYPGDDLFEPYRRRRGLPIGNLTSQFFANVYLDGLDHFCKEVMRARGYVRYVDDFALFHDDADVLHDWRDRIATYLAGRRLSLHPDKTLIDTTRCPSAVASRSGTRLTATLTAIGEYDPMRLRRGGASMSIARGEVAETGCRMLERTPNGPRSSFYFNELTFDRATAVSRRRIAGVRVPKCPHAAPNEPTSGWISISWLFEPHPFRGGICGGRTQSSWQETKRTREAVLFQ